MVQFAKNRGGVPGYMFVRFMRGSDAYLAMEQYPVTAGVEVVVLRPSASLEPVLTFASERAAAVGALPHWGKRFFVPRTTAGFPATSGECYRYAVARTQEGFSPTFSSKFTRDTGLEPGLSLGELEERTASGRVSLTAVFEAARVRLAQ